MRNNKLKFLEYFDFGKGEKKYSNNIIEIKGLKSIFSEFYN